MKPSLEQGVDADPTVQAVLAAENRLAATWERLNALRRAAFYGGRYDSAEYDSAVVAYRDAESALRFARDAWVHRRVATVVNITQFVSVESRSSETLLAA
jgi:hypothetical protein